MLTNSVYFLATAKQAQVSSFTAGGQAFHIEDQRNALEFVELENNGERSTPFWTSLGELENDLHRFQMGEQPYMVMTGLDFLRHARGRSVVLNPGTFGRQFTSRQTEVLVRRGEADEAARQKSIAPSNSGWQPSAPPAAQADAPAPQPQPVQQQAPQTQPQDSPPRAEQPQPQPQPQRGIQDSRESSESVLPDMSHGYHPHPGQQDSRASAEEEYGAQPFEDQFAEFLRNNPPQQQIHQQNDQQVGPAPQESGHAAQREVGQQQTPKHPGPPTPVNQDQPAVEAAPQPSKAEPDIINVFAFIEPAMNVMSPLIEGRSDVAWGELNRLKSQGSLEGVARAIALLFFTAMENAAPVGADRQASLNNAAEYWSEWTQWATEQDDLDLPTFEGMKELTAAQCSCGHPAFMHGRYAWALREVGIQTEAPCDESSCGCQGFAAAG